MAQLPVIAIIGRPNVGKSTLFNRLAGKKLALVDDTPGVTRDRRDADAELFGLEFKIVDTAGYEDDDPKSLPGRMRTQTEHALEEADVALFLIDARTGIVPLDEEIARWLRGSDTPIILVGNKAEGKAAEAGLYESYKLGLGAPVAISAEHGEGLGDLFAELKPHIEHDSAEDAFPGDGEAERPLKLAIVGRPNAGKSTLVNAIISEDRLITGPEAGITRDSISVPWAWHGRPVEIFDTAGMRKRAKVNDKLEKLSVADGLRALDFAEVAILLLDATLGLEAQDLRIADRIIHEGRALVIAINKWDLAVDRDALFAGIAHALGEGFSQIHGVPLVRISAKTGKGIDALFEQAFAVRDAWSRRVPTGELNRWFRDAIERNPPPAPKGRRIKLRYITQAKTRPPSFVLFGTRVDKLPKSYHRYLLNSLRRDLGFGAVPVRLTVRAPKNPYDGRSE